MLHLLSYISLHYFILITSILVQSNDSLSDNRAYGYQPGDIIIGGLFPIHQFSSSNQSCGQIRETEISLQLMHAMIYAIQRINNREDLLPGIKLGFHIHDTCSRDTIALRESILMLTPNGRDSVGNFLDQYRNLPRCANDSQPEIDERFQRQQIIGLIGPGSSRESVLVSDLLNIFRIPQISYSSTSDDLSEKERYKYFLRTVPRDYLQVRAMIDLCLHYNWSYVQFVYSEGSYGENGFKNFRSQITTLNLCIAAEYELAQSAPTHRYDTVMSSILSKSNKAKVVILFCNWGEMAKLFEAADRANAAGRIIFIGSDDWTTNTYYMNSSNYVAEGSLYFQLHGEYVRDFDRYFTQLTPYNVDRIQDPWFNESWQANFNCNLPPATENICDKSLRWTNVTGGFTQGRKIIYVINGVYAYAHALHNMHKELCKGKSGLCSAMQSIDGHLLFKYLLRVSFMDIANSSHVEFDNQGDIREGGYDIDNLQRKSDNYRSQKVGVWMLEDLLLSEDDIYWPIGNSSHILESECSQPCQEGLFKITKEEICCWVCAECISKQYFNYTLSQCIDCPAGYWPQQNRTACNRVNITHMEAEEAIAITVIIFAGMGGAFLISLVIIYVKFNLHPIIKASGRELCYCIMFSFGIICTNCVVPLWRPNMPICIWFRISIGFSFSLCYGAIFVKTTRIYRIFNHNNATLKRPSLISPRSQLFMVATIVALRLLIVLVWIIIEPPGVRRVEYKHGEEIRLICNESVVGMVITLGADSCLIIVCTVFAFLTRHLPENFNEAKFINFSMFAVMIVWLAFIPAYFTSDPRLRPLIIPIADYISVTVTILFLFVPKLLRIFGFSNGNVHGMSNNLAIKPAPTATLSSGNLFLGGH
ncbi:Metabotropic glutamate receptor 3 [Trichoplax sp. H2]|uniref:G-protein coupled receptors family 3 profile domain-containing protein n=1 Tax=Trichoplax adhaerens TaxID=10228 RepID=B3RY99_TRIAD|nr:hypothetical protein TRIADDRAFT_25549 [Trichoplax adhaerens]EDV24999.1 hypothetical protein TRIADDRAFT_25549 [Trichoplax adhaerens]RDD45887.1 Metabotropic glutamate receptor 3 [Trichoplax sp. H2]|eukprot:XP_002112889.1 hypothetical protein TRIADDRAFT_25549 [Trichoplax adhaerens]